MAKAQISIEMLVIFVAMLVVFIVIFFVFSHQIIIIINTKNSMDAFFIASTLGSAANSVFIAGNGTVVTINLMEKSANIWIADRSLFVQKENLLYDWPLLTNTTVIQSLSFNELTIRNINGVVYIG